jgi:hypothetical protein
MFIRTIKKSLLVPVLFTASVLVAAAQSPQVSAGVTSLQVDPNFAAGLNSLGVTEKAISPAVLSSGIVVFPVIGGALDASTERGEIIHSGGLEFDAGSITVQLKELTIDTTGATPVISGLIIANGSMVGRIVLFNLAPNSTSAVPGPGFTAALSSNASVTLAASAATSLNSMLNTSVLQAGLPIGTATILGVTVNGN